MHLLADTTTNATITCTVARPSHVHCASLHHKGKSQNAEGNFLGAACLHLKTAKEASVVLHDDMAQKAHNL